MIYLTEKRVSELLNWEDTINVIELALKSVSNGRTVQNNRSILNIPETNNLLMSMPGYLEQGSFKSLGCKLVTAFPNNHEKNLPSVLANILLLDENTGKLDAVIAGTEITSWRTAAASAIATKYVHQRSVTRRNNILAIIGAGVQAKIHAIAFQYIFKFNKVHIFSRNVDKANNLVSTLNNQIGGDYKYVVFNDVEQCVKDADVIVTTTFATTPLLMCEWLKQGVHINAVGAGKNVQELDDAIYKNAFVYVDHLGGIETELASLHKKGIRFEGELGAVIDKTLTLPAQDEITVFQSLGMAVEDCAMARMIYNKHFGLSPI